MMKMIKKFTLLVLTLAMVASTLPGAALAQGNAPYDTYNYDFREDIVYTPAAYLPSKSVAGTDLMYNGEPVGAFSAPQDLCKDSNGRVYVADTNNNRIVVLNSSLTEVIKIIETFNNNGKEDKFKSPQGVAVNEENHLYVADSKNKRIVVLDEENNAVSIISNPKSEVLEDGFVFTPLKVTVDYANRVYCVAQNQFEGIMVFDTSGQFTTFFGTIEVTISAWDKFWRKIATKEERSNQQLYIPTEFTGVDIDPEGFVYATNIDPNGKQGVRRLNPAGQDVIKKGKNENVGGDLQTAGTTEYAGASQFTDIVYRGDGIYSCLDRKRGRIFTYDHEGNLLYIFGGLGTQRGTFSLPVAIEDVNGDLVVLDANRGEIMFFSATEYGANINAAVALRFDGDEKEAVALWQRVLELDEDNELANTGIGKAYLTSGEYELAMKYLKLGNNRDYYSIAFKRFRNEFLVKYVGYVLSLIVGAVAVSVVIKYLKKKRKGVDNDE